MEQELEEIKKESPQKEQKPSEVEQASAGESQKLVTAAKKELSQAQEMFRQLIGLGPKVRKREILSIRSKVQKAQQILLDLASKLALGKIPEEYEVADELDELEEMVQKDRRQIEEEMEKIKRQLCRGYWIFGTIVLVFLAWYIIVVVEYHDFEAVVVPSSADPGT
jgi:glutathione S-transferase